jgi:UDP-N-acetylmuramyl pentapeptide phosphotransferase/UDP-N-acetylglucosamine-1-phosphate transferase
MNIGSSAAVVLLATAAISFILILLLLPSLRRYALAPPNIRSSHRLPTPQGGGIAVIGSMAIAIGALAIVAPHLFDNPLRLAINIASVIGIAVVGLTDDVRPLGVLPRLFLQTIAAAVVVMALPSELRVIATLPWWIERALLLIGILWFVNAVNFMDGIDWITVAEVVPLTAALAVFGTMGALPRDETLVALALCGAMIGFAPFNQPVARLFLGDVGSLPVGLLLGWLLVMLAGKGHLAAALLLPLYYLADTAITLLRRLSKGEQVTQAHRSHFYQRAMDNGFSVYAIVGRVFGLNIMLAGLAAVTLSMGSPTLRVFALLLGGGCVGVLLWRFNGARRQIP